MWRRPKWERFIQLTYCLRDSVDDISEDYVIKWRGLEDFERDALYFLSCVNVTASAERGRLVLEVAIETDSRSVVNAVLDKGVDVNGFIDCAKAPLHLAVGSDNVNVVYFSTLRENASVTAQAQEGYTALHLAASNGNAAIVRALLEHGADLSLTTHRGRTALHIAAYSGDLEVMQLLLHEIKNKCEQMLNGRQIKEVVQDHCSSNATLGAISCGIINVQDEDGWTALHIASSGKRSDILHLLLHHGADLTLKTFSDETALHITTKLSDNCTILDLLLDRATIAGRENDDTMNLDTINSQTLAGLTALHISVFLNKKDMVRALISRGADFSLKSKDMFHETALHTAVKRGNLEMVELLLHNIKEPNSSESRLDVLVSRKRINVRGRLGLTALHIAVLKTLETEYARHFRGNPQNYPLPTLGIVKILLECGAYFHIPDTRGCTPLHAAAMSNSLKITKLLLASQSSNDLDDDNSFITRKVNNINVQNNDGDTALHIVARSGAIERSKYLVMVLLYNGADLRLKNKLGQTALQIGLENIQTSLEKGCDLNRLAGMVYFLLREEIRRDAKSNHLVEYCYATMKKFNGSSVKERQPEDAFLKIAFAHNDKDMVRSLITCGARIDGDIEQWLNNDAIGSTALHTAVKQGKLEIIKLVLNKKENKVHTNKHNSCNSSILDAQDSFGYSLLHTALNYNKIDIAKFLICYGSNVNLKTKKGYSALHIAVLNGHTLIVEMLLYEDTSTDINETDLSIWRYFQRATKMRCYQDEPYLSRTKADINSRDQRGNTCLHLAAKKGLNDMVKVLLRFGADLNVKSEKGQTALHKAINPLHFQDGNVGIVELLLHEALRLGDNENSAVDQSRPCGYVNIQENEGNTALHIALDRGHANCDLVKTLLHYGADLYKTNHKCASGIQLALRNTNTSVFKLLISEGVDLNHADDRGRTPLRIAAEECSYSTVEAVLDAGADITGKDNKGRTALHHAGSGDIVDLLLSRGANIGEQSNDGSTPLHYALQCIRYKSVLDALLVASYRFDIKDSEGKVALDYCSKLLPSSDANGGRCSNSILEVLGQYKAADIMRHVSAEVDMSRTNYAKSFFYEYSLKEIEKIKSTSVDGICLYNILNYCLYDISFTKQADLRDYLQHDEFKRNFPHYFGLIKRRFEQAKNMSTLLDEVSEMFSYSLSNVLHLNIPREVSHMILLRTTPRDLMSLRDALQC